MPHFQDVIAGHYINNEQDEIDFDRLTAAIEQHKADRAATFGAVLIETFRTYSTDRTVIHAVYGNTRQELEDMIA